MPTRTEIPHAGPRRLAAFSPREKVSEGWMRGKSPWQTEVYRIADALHHHHFIRVHSFRRIIKSIQVPLLVAP
jgi:hypothetical protein